jgi:hypothetical protein
MDGLEKWAVGPPQALPRLEPQDRPVQRRGEVVADRGPKRYQPFFVFNKQIDMAEEASAALQFQRFGSRVLELDLAGEGAWGAKTPESADQLPFHINHGFLLH